MVNAINVADILEENGKTIRQNNLEKTHKIPVGTLVEVKYDEWHGIGACSKVHARLFVYSHDRDCDDTPLYTLSPYKNNLYKDYKIIGDIDGQEFAFKDEVTTSILNNMHSGFAEEDLTPIDLTTDIIEGSNSLTWKDNA